MTSELEKRNDGCQSTIYQIHLKGQLGPQWREWFAGLAVTVDENGNTLLTGPVADQAALHGLLKKVRDLGMPLLSVNCVEPEKPGTTGVMPAGSSQENSLMRNMRMKEDL